MKQQFTISQRCKALATIEATDAASALKVYAGLIGSFALVPLRAERPEKVFTHNGQSDYTCSVWSGEIQGMGRFWIRN